MALNFHTWAMGSCYEFWKARIAKNRKMFTFCSDKQDFEQKKIISKAVFSGEKK